MKHLLIACCLFISLPISHAIGNYKVGDTLFVWAYHGLSCRVQPKMEGERVATIPYSAKVVVTSKDSSLRYTVKEFGGFIMHGCWTKVLYQDSLEGYVFDAYLSTFPAYLKSNRHNDFLEDVVPYLESIFGGSKRSRKNHQPGNQDCPWKDDIYHFPKNAVAVITCGEGGYITTLEIPNFSFEEAYLWLFLNPKLDNSADPVELEITEQNRRAVRMKYELTRYIFEKKPGKIFIQCWGSG